MVTRADLSPGYQATQAAHAALAFSVEQPALTKQWHDSSNYLIVLAAPDESALLALHARAESQGLRTTLFTEPDLNDEATALVIEPGLAAERLCANLPLALREEVVAAA